MKELILNSFYFGKMGWSWKNWFWTVSTLWGYGGLEKNWLWTVSTLGGWGGLERTDFEQFLLWQGLMVLKELILNSFLFGRVWWYWKNSFWTDSSLGGSGGLERTDFEQCLLWEDVVVLKELILNSFYFGRVWWSWKKLILNSFYFGRVGWSWKDWFWTVSTLGGCDGLERTDFEQFLV